MKVHPKHQKLQKCVHQRHPKAAKMRRKRMSQAIIQNKSGSKKCIRVIP